jgi:hypothetical protein
MGTYDLILTARRMDQEFEIGRSLVVLRMTKIRKYH